MCDNLICSNCGFDEISIKYVDTHEFFIYKCYACMKTWYNNVHEMKELSERETNLIRKSIRLEKIDFSLKPCPFCGKDMDINDPDTLHPTNRMHTEWIICCVEHACGCGSSMHGDDKYNTILKWNQRSK